MNMNRPDMTENVKSENYTNKFLQKDSTTTTMEVVTQTNAVKSPTDSPATTKLVYTVEEIARMLAISLRSAYNLCNSTTDFRFLQLLFVDRQVCAFLILQFHDFGNDGIHGSVIFHQLHGLVDHQIFQPLFPHGLFIAGLFLLGGGTLIKSRYHSQIVQFWLADCRSTMWVYSPFRAYSSAGLPCSATMPPDSTTT